MEGNQARTVANIVREADRNGKLWTVLLVLFLLGSIATAQGYDSGRSAERTSREVVEHQQECQPVAGLSPDAEGRLLDTRKWVRTPAGLVEAGCA